MDGCPVAAAAAMVVPEPMNGSRIVPSPSGSSARTIMRKGRLEPLELIVSESGKDAAFSAATLLRN